MSNLDKILAAEKVTHDLVQGTDAWHSFRLQHDGASEAAAMLGLSKKVKRTELLHMKHTGLPREFSDWVQENILDHGHEVEALARPHIEAVVGEDLYPVTCSRGKVSASCDGLTLDDRIAIEHKQWNEELAAMVAAGLVPDEHQPQCQQILMVTGAEELYFVVSNGTPEKMVWAKVTPDRAWWTRLADGWVQFHADKAVYVPTEIKERPAPEVTLALPALVIHAKGEITTSNMKEYGAALATRLAEVRAIQLITDQDFSNAKESAKLLRENIQQAKHAREAMLAQTVTVGEAARMIDTWCEDMRLTALKLEQDVEREDKAKKAAMTAKAKSDYEAHIEALKAATGGPWIALPTPDWASALKNKRNFASMQDALDTMLANAKIAANESARKIRAALACIAEEGKAYEFLLADRLTLIGKPVDDLRVLIRARITEHKAEEERRLEAERAKIRREEQERADREARERETARQTQEAEDALIASIQANALRIEFDSVPYIQKAIGMFESGAKDFDADLRPRVVAAITTAREQMKAKLDAALARDVAKPAQPPAAAPIAPPVAAPQAAAANSPTVVSIKRPAPESPPTLKLGAMSERFGSGFTMTAEFVQRLGIEPAATEKASKLFHEHQFAQLCEALVAHVRTVQAKHEQRHAA